MRIKYTPSFLKDYQIFLIESLNKNVKCRIETFIYFSRISPCFRHITFSKGTNVELKTSEEAIQFSN